MAISAFAVKVPAADPLVAELRAQFDATARLGVPAHITVLVPFMPPQRITPAVLGSAAGPELQRRTGTLDVPIEAVCDSVVLLENSTGRWMQMHVFGLQQGPPV